MVGAVLVDSAAGVAWNEDCAKYIQDTMTFLSTATPGVVVLASSDYYWTSERFAIQANDTLTVQPATSDTVAPYFANFVRSLDKTGHSVLLIETVPRWINKASWDPSTCSAIKIWTGACERRTSLSLMISQQESGRQLLAKVSSLSSAHVADPWHVICDQETCSTRTGDFQRFRDAGHISSTQSDRLKERFTGHLTSIAEEHSGRTLGPS